MTVAERLGLHPAAVNASLYSVGSEPTSRIVRPKKRRAPRVRVTLDTFLDDAKAGATDAQIARSAGVTASQVRRWRLGHGITRPSGRPTTPQRLSRLAVDVFAQEYIPVLHEVSSPVSGRWEAPEYLVRTPLKFETFARGVHALADAGFTATTIAEAVGVRERDVVHALALAEARLR